jgi:hypothetical protein
MVIVSFLKQIDYPVVLVLSTQLWPLVSKWISSMFPNVEISYYVLFLR